VTVIRVGRCLVRVVVRQPWHFEDPRALSVALTRLVADVLLHRFADQADRVGEVASLGTVALRVALPAEAVLGLAGETPAVAGGRRRLASFGAELALHAATSRAVRVALEGQGVEPGWTGAALTAARDGGHQGPTAADAGAGPPAPASDADVLAWWWASDRLAAAVRGTLVAAGRLDRLRRLLGRCDPALLAEWARLLRLAAMPGPIAGAITGDRPRPGSPSAAAGAPGPSAAASTPRSAAISAADPSSAMSAKGLSAAAAPGRPAAASAEKLSAAGSAGERAPGESVEGHALAGSVEGPAVGGPAGGLAAAAFAHGRSAETAAGAEAPAGSIDGAAVGSAEEPAVGSAEEAAIAALVEGLAAASAEGSPDAAGAEGSAAAPSARGPTPAAPAEGPAAAASAQPPVASAEGTTGAAGAIDAVLDALATTTATRWGRAPERPSPDAAMPATWPQPATRPAVASEVEVASVLPFLLVGPLEELGVLDAVAAALAGPGWPDLLAAFAGCLARKVLPPPTAGWLQSPQVEATVAAFVGERRPPDGQAIERLDRAAPQWWPVVEEAVGAELVALRAPGSPLVAVPSPGGLVVADADGLAPLLWDADADAAGRLWADCGRPPVLAQPALASTALASLQPTPDTELTEPLDELVELAARRPGAGRTGLAPRLEAPLGLVAGVGLAALAFQLWQRHGERTHPALAVRRLGDLDGRVRLEADLVSVRMPLGRRHADLRDSGLLRPVDRVPWLHGRRLELLGG
jgi:hypothetical protein